MRLWGWQCPNCLITSGFAKLSKDLPAEEEAPRCCGGKPMIPFEILQTTKP